MMLKWAAAGCLVGILAGIGMPCEYTVVTKMAPEGLRYRSGSGVIEFAQISGFEMADEDRVNGISFGLFPEVVASTPFLMDLRNVPVVPVAGEPPVLLGAYLKERVRIAWWSVPLRFFQKLIVRGGGRQSLSGDPDYAEALRARLGVKVDAKSGLISVAVRMQSPEVAAQVASAALRRLSDYITEYRTGQVRRRLETAERLCRQARERYYDASFRWAAFLDTHRCRATQRVKAESERLEREAELAESFYANQSLLVNGIRIELQRQTPCYTVIEPPLAVNAVVSPSLFRLALFGIFGFGLLGVLAASRRRPIGP